MNITWFFSHSSRFTSAPDVVLFIDNRVWPGNSGPARQSARIFHRMYSAEQARNSEPGR